MAQDGLTIGEVAQRTGLAVSAIRYYEKEGLLAPWRNAGGQRRYARADLRRLSFVRIAQQLGLPLARIRQELARLPKDKAPTRADWARTGTALRADLDARIATLERLRDRLDGCIGCGCLSLDVCALNNPRDLAGQSGAGPRFVLEDATSENGN